MRRKSREVALQTLFQSEMAGTDSLEALQLLRDHFKVDERACTYAAELIAGVTAHWDDINETVQQHAVNWRMDRMSAVDRNILRLAVFEMCYNNVPASVAINEAIEIARRFSTDEATPFINGILDGVRKAIVDGSKSAG